MATKIEHARLAAVLNLLRPDWPTASLQTMLDRDHAARPFADLAVAAVAVAVDPTSTTPARLREAGPWWHLARAEPTSQPPDISQVLVEPADVANYASEAAKARELLRLVTRARAADVDQCDGSCHDSNVDCARCVSGTERMCADCTAYAAANQ
jgi:hypothetical protein